MIINIIYFQQYSQNDKTKSEKKAKKESILIPFMTTCNTSIKKCSSLICRSSLSLIKVCFLIITFWTTYVYY